MTDATIHAALSSAVADVLERMFFIEVQSGIAEPPLEMETVTARLTFDGDPPGGFQMRIARRAADAVAADFLGEDAGSLADQQSTDVTLELANMICGAALSRLDSSACFRLGKPQIVEENAGSQAEAGKIRHTVDTGRGTLTVAIRMDSRTCSPTEESAS